MPYTLNGPALFEIQIVGSLHDQTIRNVFHYAKVDAVAVADGQTAVAMMLDWFAANAYADFIAGASNEYRCTALTGQTTFPERHRLFFIPPVQTFGQQQENSLPSGCAAVLSTMSDYAGRKYQGRKYFAGIPVSYETDSKLTPVGQGWLTSIGNAVLGPITIGPTAVVPWVGKQNPTLDPVYNSQYRITDYVARDTIRYQRRREVGKGE